jgi:hypothetical protein
LTVDLPALLRLPLQAPSHGPLTIAGIDASLAEFGDAQSGGLELISDFVGAWPFSELRPLTSADFAPQTR